MLFSPFINKPDSVSAIMLKVLLALLPGIALYVWYFGPAILVSITLASITALTTEASMLKLRNRPIAPFLKDNSALLTAWLLALSLPPWAPWWKPNFLRNRQRNATRFWQTWRSNITSRLLFTKSPAS